MVVLRLRLATTPADHDAGQLGGQIMPNLPSQRAGITKLRGMASAPAIHIGKRTYTLFAAALLVTLAGCASGGSSPSTPTSETTSGISASSLIPGPTGPLESKTITVEAVPTADEAGLY